MLDFTKEYIKHCYHEMTMTEVTSRGAGAMSLDEGIFAVRISARAVTSMNGKILFIGNGGSASIASHLAVDYGLAGFRAFALTDATAISSHANDYGVEAIFSKQLELLHEQTPDILIAMSCSGKSPNVLSAVKYARNKGMGIVTLSGFDTDNPLRQLGDINFWTPTHHYGFVQISHLCLLHAVCDIEAGWHP